MIRFNSDYTEGCHTAILEKLVETNMGISWWEAHRRMSL